MERQRGAKPNCRIVGRDRGGDVFRVHSRQSKLTTDPCQPKLTPRGLGTIDTQSRGSRVALAAAWTGHLCPHRVRRHAPPLTLGRAIDPTQTGGLASRGLRGSWRLAIRTAPSTRGRVVLLARTRCTTPGPCDALRFATSAHQVLASSRLTLGSMQKFGDARRLPDPRTPGRVDAALVAVDGFGSRSAASRSGSRAVVAGASTNRQRLN
jgi:hypothetical protein